mmetsp:Transcript_15374/g.30281  ORF Transcript_15374/g.30281 Transcript_15374/m.30281 type:complete len:114 (-) Transcript_15374:21-362(-)
MTVVRMALFSVLVFRIIFTCSHAEPPPAVCPGTHDPPYHGDCATSTVSEDWKRCCNICCVQNKEKAWTFNDKTLGGGGQCGCYTLDEARKLETEGKFAVPKCGLSGICPKDEL